jgi:hypothetical protein
VGDGIAVRDTVERIEASGSPVIIDFAKIPARVEGTALAERVLRGN